MKQIENIEKTEQESNSINNTKMFSKFIDATLRRNVWRLVNPCSVSQSKSSCFNNTTLRNYYYDDNLLSIKKYEVENSVFEIITKIYMLSLIKLPKNEIIENLKKKYKEEAILGAISFLEKKNLLNEYLGIPHTHTVVATIYPMVLNNTKSKKFYIVYFRHGEEIARITSKKPKKDSPYCLHLCSNIPTFDKVPKDKWDVDIEPLTYRELSIYEMVFNKFMSKTCVVECSFNLLFFNNEKKEWIFTFEPGYDTVINHKDSKHMLKILSELFLKKIKMFGGRTITVKYDDPLKVKIKYTLPKEVIMPIILQTKISWCTLFANFPTGYGYNQKGNKKEKWALWIDERIIRSKKKDEAKNYFFIDDKSEDFDGIIMDDFEFAFPRHRQIEFMDYVTKKFKKIGVNNIKLNLEK